MSPRWRAIAPESWWRMPGPLRARTSRPRVRSLMTGDPPIEWPAEVSPGMPKNPQWRLAARPQGLFKESDFRWVEGETPPVGDGEALVRTIYLSLDPTNRGWAAGDTYLPAVPLDGVMRGIAIGRVEESRAPGLAPGDVVQGLLGWQRYAVVPASALTNLPPIPLPLSAHFGLLGHIGL